MFCPKDFKSKNDFNNTNNFSTNAPVVASHVNESSSTFTCSVDKADQHYLTSDQYAKILSLLIDKKFAKDMLSNTYCL